MRIRWTPAAAADLQGISDYLTEHHPRYRNPTMRKLYGTIRQLQEWPARGRPGGEKALARFCFLPRPMSRFTASESRPSRSCGFITLHRTAERAVSGKPGPRGRWRFHPSEFSYRFEMRRNTVVQREGSASFPLRTIRQMNFRMLSEESLLRFRASQPLKRVYSFRHVIRGFD
jgi:plasmid stabilization system protein ParE